MLSSAFEASHQPLLQSAHTNNQNNYGVIGDGSNNFVNSGNIIIEINDSEDELDKLLGRHVPTDALYNSFYSAPECHPNTRATVCNEIGQWIDDSGSDNSPLLWLNGPAGVGKSVIAKTISVLHDQVVATFFFSTSSDRSATTLFPTLAWQLAQRIPDTREHIIGALKNSSSLQTSQIEEQFDLLILQPLKRTTTLISRPVMVIDGVDECIDESMLVRFLRLLVRAGEGGGIPIRFMICSRPEPRIRAILGKADNFNPTTDGQELGLPSLLDNVLYIVIIGRRITPHHLRSEPQLHTQQSLGFAKFLQDLWELFRPRRLGFDKHAHVPSDTSSKPTDMPDRICPHPIISTIQIGFSEESKQDIARYLTDIFNAIPRFGDGTSPWFQPSDIADLAEASCGQFLYASTIARLLAELHIDPRDVLEMARYGSLPTPDLNKLYKAILKRAQNTIRNQAQDGGLNYETEWRCVMDSLKMVVFFAGNIHLFTVPKSFPVIEGLLGLAAGKLTSKLGKMHSVLSIVPGKSIHIHHRSFLEFLHSRERSGDYHILFSTASRRILTLLCRAGLRYNIFKDNDSRRHYIEDMALACRYNLLGRSSALYLVHHAIHLLMIMSAFFSTLLILLMDKVFHFLSVPAACLFTVLFFLGYFGTFIFSLTIYTFFLDRSISVAFFHPFLHPLFLFSGGFLVHSKLLFFFLFAFICWLILLIAVDV